MSRRAALRSVTGAAGLLCAPAIAQAPAFTPEAFGAKGDGRTDDYAALKRLAAAVTAAGGGTVRFGRGRQYLIDRVQVWTGPGRNDVSHIVYANCRGLRIDLNGAAIHVKGDFHRGGDARGGRMSHRNAVIPFLFDRCADLTVENGSLDGNAGRMTRDPEVGERGGHGLSISSCSQVLLQDLHVHHFSTDGIRLGMGRGNEPCRTVRLNRVRCTNNARQGLTNAGGVDVVAADCAFSASGRTGGPYRHAPSAGVDVEPFSRGSVRSDFRALRCRFDDNVGYPFVATGPHRTSFVELIDCGGRSPSQERLLLACERATIRGGSWHNIQIACAYAAHRPFDREISIDVSGGLWTGDDPAWAPVYDLSPRRPKVRIHNNRFELRPASAFGSAPRFQCANPNQLFEGNDIFVSRVGHPGTGDYVVGNFRRAGLVRGNRWRTDASAPLLFVNDYRMARTVEGESYSGSFAPLAQGLGSPGEAGYSRPNWLASPGGRG